MDTVAIARIIALLAAIFFAYRLWSGVIVDVAYDDRHANDRRGDRIMLDAIIFIVLICLFATLAVAPDEIKFFPGT